MGKKFLLTALAAVLTIGALTGCAKTGSESKNSSKVKSANNHLGSLQASRYSLGRLQQG